MSSSQSENSSYEKKSKPKRAERQIYRPGALRQLKTQFVLVTTEKSSIDSVKSQTESSVTPTILKNKVPDKEIASLSENISDLNIKSPKEKYHSLGADKKKPEAEIKNSVPLSKSEKNSFSPNNLKHKSTPQQDNYYKGGYKQKRNDYYKSNYKEHQNSVVENSTYKHKDKEITTRKSVVKISKDDTYSKSPKEELYNTTRSRSNTGINKDTRVKKPNLDTEEKLSNKIVNKEDRSNSLCTKSNEYKCTNDNTYKDSYQDGPKKSRFKNTNEGSSYHYKSEYKNSWNTSNDYEYYNEKQIYDKNKRNHKKQIYNEPRPRYIKNKDIKDNCYSKQENLACKFDRNNIPNDKNQSNQSVKRDDDCKKNSFKYPDKIIHNSDKKEKSKPFKHNESQINEEHKIESKQNPSEGDVKDMSKSKVLTSTPKKIELVSLDNNLKGTEESFEVKLLKNDTKLSQSKINCNESSEIIPSSEESISDEGSVVSEKSRKTVNPMLFVDFKENSFYENPSYNKTIGRRFQSKGSHSGNTSWSDEKWSPPQR